MEQTSEQIESAIAALEAQRALLGDAVVDIAVAPLHEKLLVLRHCESPSQQLKTATVLFMDVVGSTQMSERLDPEDVHAVMDTILERLTSIVHIHNGRVLQYAGDSLLAVFGADQALEDDAERAVRAGLAILAAGAPLAADLGEVYDLERVALRVGIHTGPVLLGGGIDAEGSIRGVSVNIAARMEQTAPAGALRISHETYRLVRGIFDVEAQPPIEIKGITGTVRSYLVLRAKPRAFRLANRGLEGVDTQMVGRDADLARIVERFHEVCERKALRQLTIVGDPGIGKSRLGFEFAHWLEMRSEPVRFFQCRPQPYGNNIPYGLLRDLLAWRFEILESDAQSVAQRKLAAGLGQVLGEKAAESTALIGQLIGFDYHCDPHIAVIAREAKQIRDRAFHALASYFGAVHSQSGMPIVLLFDDLHWADEGSLDFLHYMVDACGNVPILMLCLTRPTLYERRPLWGGGRVDHCRIDLAPLSSQGARELIESLLRRLAAVPMALRDLLVSSADGNPYFVEELVGMLIDDGVIVTDCDPWRVSGERLLDARVPTTLAGVVQARIDGLPEEEKSTLQRASVIGYVFWDEVLQHNYPAAAGALSSLVRRDLAHARDTSAFEGAREFVFQHHVLHQVTYQGVLKQLRREIHGAAAAWLLRRGGDRASEYFGMIAEHYERADDRGNAAVYLRRAGENAARCFANDAAVDYFSRAISLTPASDKRTLFELILQRKRIFGVTGQLVELEADVRALEELAEELNDDAKRAQAAVSRSDVAFRAGEFLRTIAAAQRAIALATAVGTPDVMLLALNLWSAALRFQADYENARVQAVRALELARQCGDRIQEGNLLLQLGILTTQEGKGPAVSRRYYAEARAIARATGDRFTEAGAINAIGSGMLSIGNYAAASELFHIGRQICGEIGHRRGDGILLINLAYVSLERADPSEAMRCLEKAEVIFRETGDRNLQANELYVRGNALMALGDREEAARCYRESVAIYRGMGRPNMPPEPLAGLARLFLQAGDLSAAGAYVKEILDHLDGGGTLSGTTDDNAILFTCYEVLRASGASRANEILNLAYSEMMSVAAQLDQDERASFLHNKSTNRAIASAMARSASGDSGSPGDCKPVI